MHEYGPVILLLLGIFAGIWLNRRDYTDLKTDLNRQLAEFRAEVQRQIGEARSEASRQLSDFRAEVNRRFDDVNVRLNSLEEGYREFYGMEKKLEGRVDELSRR